jgi:hypothetical protein
MSVTTPTSGLIASIHFGETFVANEMGSSIPEFATASRKKLDA